MPPITRLSLLALSPLALAACATTGAIESTQIAAAGLFDAKGANVGEARFLREGDTVRMVVDVTALPAGPHGIHLHTTGSCEAPGFTSAGGHLNPAKRQHGAMNPMGSHLGDLPNLQVTSSGHGHLSATLAGPAAEVEADLFDADGTAVVVHGGPDDYKSDPAGNAGARIACGVVARG